MKSNTSESFFEKLNRWFRNSISFKIFSVGFLALLMLIPTGMIQDLIRERQLRQQEAIREINSKWALSQTITGPIITIPYWELVIDEEDNTRKVKRHAHFLPSALSIDGKVNSEKRSRGIYESVMYSTDLVLKGAFQFPDFSQLKIKEENVIWNEALILMGVSDLRGINESVDIEIAGKKVPMESGIPVKDLLSSGISGDFSFDTMKNLTTLPFSTQLSIKGSEDLKFIPIGAKTKVKLNSDWPHPSFNGFFLPDERTISNNGFTATWEILQLNRNYPQQWTNRDFNFIDSEFGLNLLVGVDQYQKNERSAKYAFMIIALTFLLFFFIEVLNKKRIHPIQYLLVGFSLSVFYTLLLSFSEKFSFSLSYLISSIAVIGLITLYVHAFFKKIKFTGLLTGTLTLLFAFVFVILQLQDYALMVGSIGVFIILAVVMYTTRKLDWYALSQEE